MKALPADFYNRPVLDVARDLIGCTLEHAGTAGVIVETEAYHESEPACHAFVGLTQRTRILFGAPGRAYVYRSYGIHALFNAVCEPEGIAAAVLIRALDPTVGLELMRERRMSKSAARPLMATALRDSELCSGPGKLTQALAITLADNGSSLRQGPVRIGEGSGSDRVEHALGRVVTGGRVGITQAVELPWRFSLLGNPHVSRPRPRG
jgi:DNA-3-methyladenine glycosylase